MATGRPAGRPRKITSESGGIERIPTPPTKMSAEGKKLWRRIWNEGREWLSTSDYTVMELLVNHMMEYDKRKKMIENGEVPLYYEQMNGSLASHPIYTQMERLFTQINSLMASLGLTPADRAKLGMMNAASEDALDEYLAGRKERDDARAARRRAASK